VGTAPGDPRSEPGTGFAHAVALRKAVPTLRLSPPRRGEFLCHDHGDVIVTSITVALTTVTAIVT